MASGRLELLETVTTFTECDWNGKLRPRARKP